MQEQKEAVPPRHGLKLLGVKVLLGAAAAVFAMILMRAAGGGEFMVALAVGLVPGIAERSPKKLLAGAVLGLVGYSIGARVGFLVAKSASGVPLGHWATTGAFIGATAGIRRHSDQPASARVAGGILGIFFGFVFGLMGDIGGFFTIPAYKLPLFYYLREVSLLCAGIFINLGAGLASMLAVAIERRAKRTIAPIQEAKA
jgi:hypothetical protein